MTNIKYLVLYTDSIRKLIKMNHKKEIQLSTETQNKLTELLRQTDKQTENKIRFLLNFLSYDFEKMEIMDNKITIELYKIFLKHGNKNLIYGLKFKEV